MDSNPNTEAFAGLDPHGDVRVDTFSEKHDWLKECRFSTAKYLRLSVVRRSALIVVADHNNALAFVSPR